MQNNHLKPLFPLSEGPSFGNTATYHEFLQGTDSVVPCLVTGQPVVDVVWLRDKQEILTAGRKHNGWILILEPKL